MGDLFPVLPWFQAPEPKIQRRTRNMSNNYRFYAEKMEELRVCREINRPLLSQLHELLLFVKECEARWESRGTKATDGSAPGV
jgi:hypothetical protein